MALFIGKMLGMLLFAGLGRSKGDLAMTRYCGERELEHRLRRIVLHSADVLPEIVSLYLKEIIDMDDADAEEDALKNYHPLVDKIPKDFVDFACNVLIADIEQIKEEHSKYASQMIGDSFDLEIYNGVYKLGIADNDEFFPPAHIQGPFLYLLNKNEDEGLRLIQTLTNTAVTRWREFQQGRYNRLISANKTPLPTLIDLPSGSHEFWGDEQVYHWYRPHSTGPNVITSGLMALEAWIEEQIEKDRNSEELFNKILSGSKCVAILGICLGIALEYPKKCLKAALPIACSPAVWRMDVDRHASDCHEPYNFDLFDVFGLHKYIQKAQDERNRRPQRFLDVRNLAIHYVLSADDETKGKFENAISHFIDNLPFLFEEERNDQDLIKSLCRKMERFQIYGNKDYYRIARVNDQLQILVDPPDHIKKIDDAVLKPVVESQRLLTLSYWADKSIEKGDAAEGLTLESAVEAAKEFQKPGDFSAPYDLSNFPDVLRLQAIAGVAAAVLIINYQRAEELGLVGWCKEILLSAACMPYEGIYPKETIIPMDPKVFAGRGLGVIAAHSEKADKNIGTHLLSLVCDPYEETVESVFIGIRDVWNVDEALCWNALCLGLSLCLCPKKLELDRSETRLKDKYEWLQSTFSKYFKNYTKNIIPSLPRIPQTERELIFDWKLALQLISCLSLSERVKNPNYSPALNYLYLKSEIHYYVLPGTNPY